MAELTSDERVQLSSVLGEERAMPAAGTASYLIVVDTFDGEHKVSDALAGFVSAVRVLRVDQSDTFLRLIAAMTPLRTSGRGIAVQAQRNAAARAALEDEFGLLTSAEVAQRAQTNAKNTSSLAGRWRKEGRIFAVPSGDSALLYPAFQFDSGGRPLPVIAQVISKLAGLVDGWSFALWFVGANGWLGGARPVDVLDDDQVIYAAEQLAAEIR